MWLYNKFTLLNQLTVGAKNTEKDTKLSLTTRSKMLQRIEANEEMGDLQVQQIDYSNDDDYAEKFKEGLAADPIFSEFDKENQSGKNINDAINLAVNDLIYNNPQSDPNDPATKFREGLKGEESGSIKPHFKLDDNTKKRIYDRAIKQFGWNEG